MKTNKGATRRKNLNRPKHCTSCGSSRVVVKGLKWSCKACGYVNDSNPRKEAEYGKYKVEKPVEINNMKIEHVAIMPDGSVQSKVSFKGVEPKPIPSWIQMLLDGNPVKKRFATQTLELIPTQEVEDFIRKGIEDGTLTEGQLWTKFGMKIIDDNSKKEGDK